MKKTVISLAITALISGNTYAFSDVNEGMFYKDSVNFLEDEGIVNGYSDGTFGYNKQINRAEFLKILVEARSDDEDFLETFSDDSCFKDVRAGNWYTKYICFAKEHGLIDGYPDGSFKPANNINFVEATKIVLRVFEEDFSSTNPWYKGLVEKASKQNLIPPTITKFEQKITRAETADLIARKMKFENGDLEDFLGNRAEVRVTYESIKAGKNIFEFDPLSESGGILDSVNLNVPFTAQAPSGSWVLPYSEACEEASIIMAEYFLRDEKLNSDTADKEILALTSWVSSRGYKVDVSAQQSADIALDFHGRKGKVYYDEDVTIENMKRLLSAGYVLIVPAAGHVLNNPNYVGAGPPYHMVVVKGYDDTNFITHDPGTRNGADFKYEQNLFYDAIHDWAGSKSNVLEGRKAFLVMYN